jgi:hypothetical protein
VTLRIHCGSVGRPRFFQPWVVEQAVTQASQEAVHLLVSINNPQRTRELAPAVAPRPAA